MNAKPKNAVRRSSRPPASPPGASRAALAALLALLLLLLGGIAYVFVTIGPTPPAPVAKGGGNAAIRELSSVQKTLQEAESAFREGDYARTIRLLEPVTAQHPQDQEPRLLLAQAFCGLKDYASAYTQMDAAIGIGPAAPELHFDAGTIANQAGLVDQAAEHYALAQTARPSEPKYPLFLAMIQIKLGQTGPARASLVRAVTLNPDLAEGWGTLSELELKENALGLALDHARKAKDMQPRAARWRLVEARVLSRQGDTDGALAAVLALDEPDRLRPEALGLLAECFGLKNEPAKAAEAYARAGEVRPNDAEMHYQAANWFKRAGNLELARKHARRARDLGHPKGEELLASMAG